MLQGEHSAILSTFIRLTFIIKIFVLSIFEWPLKTSFTVCIKYQNIMCWPIAYLKDSCVKGACDVPLTNQRTGGICYGEL